tara:strand:- start:3382 stop:3738 length:357 start_codon:yes stop_codon:yes gene_type:complete
MLTAPELLTLIKAHNILSKIKVPAKARKDAAALEKLINEADYKVDHDKKVIKPMVKRGKQLKLKTAEELTKPKPKKEQTSEQKEKKSVNEKKKVIDYILKNKEVLNDPEVMKLHKGLK